MQSTRTRLLALAMLVLTAIPGSAQETTKDIVQSRLIAPSDPVAYFDRVQEGIRLLNGGKFEDAVQRLQGSVAEYPADGVVWIISVKRCAKRNDRRKR